MTRHRLLKSLKLLGILLGIAGLAGYLYLISPACASRVADKLAVVYGGRVGLGHLSPGLLSQTLAGLQLYEAGPDAPEQPWLTANLNANVALWDLLRGDAQPSVLTLYSARLTLRFDREGRLLTRLPEAAEPTEPGGMPPRVVLRDARLTLRQEGRPELVVEGVSAELRGEGEKLVLAGRVVDPRWSSWDVSGNFAAKGESTLVLKTARSHITQPMLDSLPFVPPTVWKQVQAEGDTSCLVTVRLPQAELARYRVELELTGAKVYIPSIDLSADQTQGRVVVEDGLVQLRNVTGRVAAGKLDVTGDLDFRTPTSKLNFKLDAQKLDLHGLPVSWALPAQIQGRLSGQADLQVHIAPDRLTTSGEGQGQIHEVRIAGIPAPVPIKLRLGAEGQRFRFFIPKLFLPDRRRSAWGGWPQRLPPPAPSPTYLEVCLALNDTDLAELLGRLKVPLPLPAAGRLSADLVLAVSINAPRARQDYRLAGTVRLPWCRLGAVELVQVHARLGYDQGVLRLEALDGLVPGSDPPAMLHAVAQAELVPQGELRIAGRLDDMPLSSLWRLAQGNDQPGADAPGGTLSLGGDAHVSLGRWRDVKAWQASATLTGDAAAGGWGLTELAGALALRDGTLTVRAAQGRFAGTPLAGSGSLGLSAPYRFEGRGAMSRGPQTLALPAATDEVVSAQLELTAEVAGTLAPLHWQAAGKGRAEDLRLGDWYVGDLAGRWEGDRETVRFRELVLDSPGGRLTGEAVLPLGPERAAGLDISFTELEIGDLAQETPLSSLAVDGKITGKLVASLAAASPIGQRELSAQLDLHSGRVRLQRIPIDRLSGTVSYRGGALAYRSSGDCLGGRLHLEGNLSADPAPAPPPLGGKEEWGGGRLRIERVELARLLDAHDLASASIRGAIDLEVNFRHDGPDHWPAGTGRFALSSLRWRDAEWASRIQGDIVLSPEKVRIKNLTGSLGQGLLLGQLGWNLGSPGRGWFQVSLQGAQSRLLLAPWPGLADSIDGPVDLKFRGNLARECRGAGELTFTRGSVLGVEVADCRLPIDFTVVPARGRGELAVRESRAQVARGQVQGRASYRFGEEDRLEGTARFYGVRLQHLVTSTQVAGELAGRLDFAGSALRSLDDLSGSVEATLKQGQVLDLPVFKQMAPYIAPGRSLATFHDGTLRARLSHGIVRVERLRLTGPVLQALMEGTVTLHGRLGLEVTANPGLSSRDLPVLRALGIRVPAIGAIPVGLLNEASSFLIGRLIHLHIGGTLKNPVVRAVPLSSLPEEAVRFFLSFGGR